MAKKNPNDAMTPTVRASRQKEEELEADIQVLRDRLAELEQHVMRLSVKLDKLF